MLPRSLLQYADIFPSWATVNVRFFCCHAFSKHGGSYLARNCWSTFQNKGAFAVAEYRQLNRLGANAHGVNTNQQSHIHECMNACFVAAEYATVFRPPTCNYNLGFMIMSRTAQQFNTRLCICKSLKGWENTPFLSNQTFSCGMCSAGSYRPLCVRSWPWQAAWRLEDPKSGPLCTWGISGCLHLCFLHVFAAFRTGQKVYVVSYLFD